mgnify:CR=1 FL=1
MINTSDILETINMIREENLDIRTITMGISLLDCVSEDETRLCEKIYDKITKKAEKLVKTGEEIERDYGVPIVNKRISVTPVSLVGGSLSPDGYIKVAKTLDTYYNISYLCILICNSYGRRTKEETRREFRCLRVLPQERRKRYRQNIEFSL